ncbi:MAG: SDR family oxidoreductase [Deltaproteobacteria bacterium]|nr:SDR family oxidoreductase [Deltaproteobacteria bacterium]
MRLAGKVALITGAGSGQGRAAAVLFAKEGAKVVVTDVNEEGIKGTLEMVRSAGGEAAGRRMDVADAAQIQDGVAFAVRTFGALNVLYNNAGVYLRGKDGPVTRVEEDIWDTTLNVNLKSMYLCCKHTIPEMIKVGGGAIVNTASAAGLVGSNFHAYSASKGGMIALSRSIATTYAAQNIRSNVICPGFIDTPMVAEISGSQRLLQAYLESTPLHRAGKPIDIAYMALYLASDEAAFVTGGVFVVDGGVTAR